MPGPAVRPLRSVTPPPPPSAAGGLTGRVIGDRYRLLHPIAEGPHSAVYKAEHVRMGKALCVKLLRGRAAREHDLVARFRAEARIVSRLSHPHTVAVFDFGELEGREGLYLAMEYLHGENLQDVLRRERRLPHARAVAIGKQLLGALGEAHEAGIVHRDVKPANVVLVQHRNVPDFVKLLDFGIAAFEGADTAGGVGTPTYLSPEQARGAAPDARSDLYSLGALLYEVLAGRPPHVAENPLAVLSAHLNEEPAPLASHCPEVPPEVAAVVHRALAKDPEARFQGADAMRVALQGAGAVEVGGAAPQAPEDEVTGELEIARRGDFPVAAAPAGKDPRRALLPAAVALVGALAVLVAASRIARSSPTETDEQEPNAPEASLAAAAGPQAWQAWAEQAARNPLGDADVVRAHTGGADVDAFAIRPHVREPIPGVVLLVPQPGLALEADAWPAPSSLAGRPAQAGFAPLARGDRGEPLLARLPAMPTPGAPVLLRVRAASGEGRYRVVALGSEAASGKALLAEIARLESEGRPDEALLVASSFARLEPASPVRGEVLRAAGRLANRAARTLDGTAPTTKGAGP